MTAKKAHEWMDRVTWPVGLWEGHPPVLKWLTREYVQRCIDAQEPFYSNGIWESEPEYHVFDKGTR